MSFTRLSFYRTNSRTQRSVSRSRVRCSIVASCGNNEMLAPFPNSAIINVPGTVATDLLRAAEALPLYDKNDFYSITLQSLVADTLHEECRHSFEWLIGTIAEGLARWPYCVLIRGLRF